SSLPLIRTCGAQRGILPCGASRRPPATTEDAKMEANENKVTRKGSTPIKVYCLPDERAAIEANAQAAGMSTSAYLLAVGQGYQVKGVTDFENVRDLVRVNGDLGRLGGLLKLWLTDDPRTARFGDDTIRALLARIEATQDKISTIAESVVRPRGGQS
ncbi:conjugal transfer transcriptional regulator TraJ, partial [Pseudomonas aeruginosa]|uniref:conjugal transfer transcriptional regulator TraJ n=1 Tax=Pseudomonas aeruginosa TaxID=287 RepID=UPI003F936EDA